MTRYHYPGLLWFLIDLAFILGYSQLSWAILGYPGLSWFILGHPGLYWVILGYPGLSWDILGYTGLFWVILGYLGGHRSRFYTWMIGIPVYSKASCTHTYKYTRTFTLNLPTYLLACVREMGGNLENL